MTFPTTQASSGSRSFENDHHPNALRASSTTLKKDDKQPASSREANNLRGSSWEKWSSVFEVKPSLAGGIEGERDEHAEAEQARPRTAVGAMESFLSILPGTRSSHRPPPAGMMTVTVRRGSEETNVVTPIVLTESGGEGTGATTTPPSVPVSAGGGLLVTAGSSSLGDDGQSRRINRASAMALLETANNTSAKGTSAVVGGVADAPKTYIVRPAARGEVTAEKGEFPAAAVEAVPGSANTAAALSTPKTNFTEPTVEDQSARIPPPTILMSNNGTPVDQPANQVATEATSAPVANVLSSEKSDEEGDRTAIKPTEQLFMEDTQVYLGCRVCGVKYLVEAVEPGSEQSTKGDSRRGFLICDLECGWMVTNLFSEAQKVQHRVHVEFCGF